MLVTFEGQVCAGKSAVAEAVSRQLRARGVGCSAVVGFPSEAGSFASDSLWWDGLIDQRLVDPVELIVRSMDLVRGLYALDERVIGPALDQHSVVLAERHMDTAVFMLAPALGRLRAIGRPERAAVLLGLLLSELKHQPDLTVYVDASLPTRVERIETFRRGLLDSRTVSAAAIDTFDSYSRVAAQLIGDSPERFLRVDNDQPVDEVARPIVDAVVERHGAEARVRLVAEATDDLAAQRPVERAARLRELTLVRLGRRRLLLALGLGLAPRLFGLAAHVFLGLAPGLLGLLLRLFVGLALGFFVGLAPGLFVGPATGLLGLLPGLFLRPAPRC